MWFWVVPQKRESPQANFIYILSTAVKRFLLEELINPYFKEKLSMLEATIVSKCGYLVTQANVEVFVVGNIPFGGEAISTTKSKDTEHAMPYQDYAPTSDQSN